MPPPSRALKQGGIAERAITKRNEQAVRSVGPSRPFLASDAGRFDERNPPPDKVIPDGPGEAARALNKQLHPMRDELPAHSAPPAIDHTDRGGVPAFLHRAGVRVPELAPKPEPVPYWEAALVE